MRDTIPMSRRVCDSPAASVQCTVPGQIAQESRTTATNVHVSNRTAEIDDQGWLVDPDDWSEVSAESVAAQDGITLYDESWGLIGHFREHNSRYSTHPGMRQLVRVLGRQHGPHFHDRKVYERFLHRRIPRNPVRALCQLAGLPKPEPDT